MWLWRLILSRGEMLSVDQRLLGGGRPWLDKSCTFLRTLLVSRLTGPLHKPGGLGLHWSAAIVSIAILDRTLELLDRRPGGVWGAGSLIWGLLRVRRS